MINNKKKQTIGMILAAAMTVLAVTPALAGTGYLPDHGAAQQVRAEAGTFSIQSRDMVLKAEGRSWTAWNQEFQKCRQEAAERQISRKELLEFCPDAEILEKDQAIYYINGELPFTVSGPESAASAAYRMITLLGRDMDTELEWLSRITTDRFSVYVFQEIYQGQTVPSSTIRLVADPSGQLISVFSSLARELPEDNGTVTIDGEEAADIVSSYLKEEGIKGSVLAEYTSPIYVTPEDEESEEEEAEEEVPAVYPDLQRWVVYTENKEIPEEGESPYLAHYLSADGSYLYHQSVKEPGDEAGQSGYDTAYMFDQMEPEEWTGEVTLLDESTKTVTVPVMKDPASGLYYLGDAQRRIIIADFSDYAYNDDLLTFASSETNDGWNNEDLISYSNYIKVWDYYAQLGWQGPDGMGTPTLLLKDMKTEDGLDQDNAAYITDYAGWQIFAYDNSTCHVGEGLDVWAHEFTHAVTETVQGANLYENDRGAINESMSDILGNLCEMILQPESDDSWLIGEDTLTTIRSMLDPHMFGQPEYVWDIYYAPATAYPNDSNDYGGVHFNSSILNLLAARLCQQENMDLATARDYWMYVMCGITPETDFLQMADVLIWAMNQSGNTGYLDALNGLIEDGRLRMTEMPEEMEPGRIKAFLQLPDTDAMKDKNWSLCAYQLNGDRLLDVVSSLADLFTDESLDPEELEPELSAEDAMMQLLRQYTSYVTDEQNSISMILEDSPTLYSLMNMDPETLDVNKWLILVGDQWIDITSMFDGSEHESDSLSEVMESAGEMLLSAGKGLLGSFLNIFSEEPAPDAGTAVELPSEGLEKVTLE